MTEKLSPLTVLREHAAEFGVADTTCSNCAAFSDLDGDDTGVCERRSEKQFRFGICLDWTLDEDFTPGDRGPQAANEDEEVEVAGRCAEPGCDGLLEKRYSKQLGSYFYGCCNYPECDGILPANEDGTPRGEPRTRELMAARTEAHAAFDKLWQEGHCDRGAAYSWLRAATGFSHHEAHMFRMNQEQCRLVIRLVETHGPGTGFWQRWKTERAERKREKAKAKRRRSRKGSSKRRSSGQSKPRD